MSVTVYWCVYKAVCRFVYMIADAFRDQKSVSEFLKLELPVVVNYLKVGAGNGTLILWKNNMSQTNMAKSVYEVYLESDMVK